MAAISTYLTFNGNTEEVFNFYQSVFGGEFTEIHKFNTMPPQEGMPPLRKPNYACEFSYRNIYVIW